MIEAWEWAVTHRNDDPDNPIMIISTSFGGGYFTSESSCNNASPTLTATAANAKAAGITIFASTGNEGYCDGTGWPACMTDVVGVGAVYDADIGQSPEPGYVGCISTDSCTGFTKDCPCDKCYIDYSTAADQVPTYSNSASFMELFAPSNNAYTTELGGGYTSDFGGTSAACPYAAGAGAVLQAAYKARTGSWMTPDRLQAVLTATGDSITDAKAGITKPRINLSKAVATLNGFLPAVYQLLLF
jgi:subtilisin family serine protease